MVKTGDQFQKNTAYEHPEKKHFITSSLGYSRVEVDQFMRKLADAPDHISPKALTEQNFSTSAFGYDKQDVRFYLKQFASYRYRLNHQAEFQDARRAILAEIDLTQTNFSKSLRGYCIEQVDTFLEHQPNLETIASAEFKTQFYGYNKRQVQLYFEALVEKLKGNL